MSLQVFDPAPTPPPLPAGVRRRLQGRRAARGAAPSHGRGLHLRTLRWHHRQAWPLPDQDHAGGGDKCWGWVAGTQNAFAEHCTQRGRCACDSHPINETSQRSAISVLWTHSSTPTLSFSPVQIAEECGYHVEEKDIQRVTSLITALGISGPRMTVFYAEVEEAGSIGQRGGVRCGVVCGFEGRRHLPEPRQALPGLSRTRQSRNSTTSTAGA